jgi:hypothetical protein
MTGWGCDKGDGLQYEQGIIKVQEYYALLFKDRFYFVSLYCARSKLSVFTSLKHDIRDCSTDSSYQKAVAYDEKTIRYRRRQRTHVTSSTTVEINYRTEAPSHSPSKLTPKSYSSLRSDLRRNRGTRWEDFIHIMKHIREWSPAKTLCYLES